MARLRIAGRSAPSRATARRGDAQSCTFRSEARFCVHRALLHAGEENRYKRPIVHKNSLEVLEKCGKIKAMFDATKIDHLGESLFELEGAHYLYREAMAARFRNAGDGSARADQVEALRAQLRGAIESVRYERARADAATSAALEPGVWGPEHTEWLDSLLGADVERVKRHVGVLGFED